MSCELTRIHEQVLHVFWYIDGGGVTKRAWKNKSSSGIWQQIVGKLKSKAALTELVCDVVWITRCRTESGNTFISVSEPESLCVRVCVRALLRKLWYSH